MEQRRRFMFALMALTGAMLLAGGGRALAQGGSWLKAERMLTPRRLLAAAAEDGKLYTFGGCGSPCFGPPFHTSADEETKVEVYLPQQKRWVEKRRMPTIFFGGVAAAPGNGKIYTFGGYVSGNVVQEYDPVANSWKLKRPMPTPRYGLAAVALNGKVYVLGGSGPSGALEIYDPATDTWTQGAPMRTPRVFLAAAAVDGKIYAVGGSPDCCGKSQTDAVEIYDPVKNVWEAGTPLPSERQVSAAVGMNGKVYIFGGFIPGSGVQADTFEYDPKTKRWTFMTPMPVAKDQAPAVLIGSHVFIPGGSITCHCRAIGDNDEFELSTLTCTKDGPTSVAQGEILTYTIRVKNSGSAAVDGVTLNDPSPEGFVFVPDSQKLCGNGFPCDLGRLAPGDERSVDVNFQVVASGSCDSSSEITNVAKVSAKDVDSVECKATSVLGGPVLKCTKGGPPSARAGDRVTYEVTVSNIGCKPANNVVLSDPTPDGLVADDGTPCVKSPCNLGTINPKKSRRVELSFRVAEGCSDQTSIVNLAKVSGSGGLSTTCSVETLLPPEADLALDVSAPDHVSGEATFDLPVKVSNAGPATARNGILTLDIQGAGSVTSPGCTADLIPGRFTCHLGDIACGTDKTLKFEVRAPACAVACPPTPVIEVSAEVRSDTPDLHLSNNSASDQVQVDCVCLDIEKTDDPDPVAPGGELSYTITVKNIGTLDAPGVIVKDIPPPPDELTEIQWCQVGKDCPPKNPLPLDTKVDIPAGSSKVFRMRGIVGSVSLLENKVSAEHPRAKKVEDVETTSVVAEGISLLCTEIIGTSAEGETITCTFEITNHGPAVQMDNPGDEFTTTLPAGLTLVSAAPPSSGTVSTADNTVTWNGEIQVEETVTIMFDATIDVGTAGTTLCLQAKGFFDLDGNGTNETELLSDDPGVPGDADPCCFFVSYPPGPAIIPTLSDLAAVALMLLLATLAIRRLRTSC